MARSMSERCGQPPIPTETMNALQAGHFVLELAEEAARRSRLLRQGCIHELGQSTNSSEELKS